MGNQLSSVAPGQIFPVENYLLEYNSNRGSKELEFEKSLGSTRFLKVAKCYSEESNVVVKVFVINDPVLPISEHKKKINDLSLKLSTAFNCLPFHRIEKTERCALIIRPFIKSSLYDRISTRPFLTLIEKKWLAFQLLIGINYCHEQLICHGDIKLENLMVSSWSWLTLTDFATFKPVLLPEDNPADFTYYFDTSRRRVCYIAPERFVKILQREEDQVLKEVKDKGTELTPAMDMFSTGCVLAELFTEGMYPFNLMQLFQYRSDKYYPDNVLNEITDERIKDMVRQMIQKDPQNRKSASFYLSSERGKTFPEYFYSFLQPFCQQFTQSPGISADERVTRIEDSFNNILEAFEVNHQTTSPSVQEETVPKKPIKNESLIVIISIITSCIRSLQYLSTKLSALELLKKLSSHVPDEIILDRIIPFILNLLKDEDSKVRAESVSVLTECLTVVTSVPRSEINIFSEYIFPHLYEVTTDNDSLVREMEAANIATIADTALRFVEYCLQCGLIMKPESNVEALQDIVQEKLSKLFSDSSNTVKRTTIEENIVKLCAFFGRDKANDILLSHVITFLNEKKDFHLRLSFFQNCTGIATYIGQNCSTFLKPLIIQALSDSEELVIVEALDTLSSLTEIEIFPHHILWDLIQETAPLLIHPNSWIRQAVVGFVVTAAKALPYLDQLTTVSEAMKPFMTKSIVQYDKEESILSGLKKPLSRDTYDTLVKSPDVKIILEILDKRLSEGRPLETLPSLNTVDQQTRNIFRRLIGSGLTKEYVNLLSYLKDHLIKVHKYKKALMDFGQGRSSVLNNSIINIDEEMQSENFFPNHHRLISSETSSQMSNIPSQTLPKSSSLTMNEEWKTMFGNSSPVDNGEIKMPSSSSLTKTLPSNSTSSSQSFMLDQSQMEKNNVSKCLAQCQKEFDDLMTMKVEEALVSSQSKKYTTHHFHDENSLPSKWKLKGHLVSHLHEHKEAVSSLVALQGTTLFASSSHDGSVKIWDCDKTERRFPINRSKSTYTQQKGKINRLAYCSVQESFASSSSDKSSIHVVKVDKQALVASRQLDKVKEGHAYDLHYMEAGQHSLLTYSTVFGDIVGWDLRSPGNAWIIKNGCRNGLLTSYVIDPSNNWLACGFTSSTIIGWDLRFMLKISQLKSPLAQGGIQSLKLHPTNPSWVISSTRSNNEVVFWDLESQSRMKTLWASSVKPLQSNSGPNPVQENWINSIIPCETESGGVFVITGGTDSRIRHWDLDAPECSSIISQIASYNGHSNFSYSSNVIKGSEVLIETVTPKQADQDPVNEVPQMIPDQPATGHKDLINDMILVHKPQKLLISCAFDGTIKIWK